MPELIQNLVERIEALEKRVIAENAKKFPVPPTGDDGKAMTIEELRKLSASERYRFSQEHPEEYKEFYGGKS